MIARDQRQLGAEAGVEVGEGRHDLQDDDRDEHERERDQDRRIDERRHRLALHRRDDLRVLDEAPQHRVEAAAPLAGQQRRGVDARKQRAVRGERIRQRGARAHPLVDVVEHAAEHRRLDPAPQQVERLHERHAGLEQRRQLLVEHEELAGRDPPRSAEPQRHAGHRAFRLQRQDVEALLLEVVAQPGFAVGRVDALDDLTARGREPAPELHYSA